MFGKMNVIPVLDLQHVPPEAAASSDGAVTRLLEATDNPRIERWIQFPRALVLFLIVPGDDESGAFYVYDRRLRIWYWVDFDDEKFGGYSANDFERLVRECRFLDLAEKPQLLTRREPWILMPGCRPSQSIGVATATAA